jgi:hypothetical protein
METSTVSRRPSDDDFGDALTCLSIPQRRHRPRSGTTRGERGSYLIGERLTRHETIGTVRDSDRSFRVRAQRQARNAQDRGFFLDAARVGHDDSGAADCTDEVDISDRIDDPHACMAIEPGLT